MLNDAQISYLSGLSDFEPVRIGSAIVGVKLKCPVFKHLKIPIDEFRESMGLDDLRLGWLLSPNCCMAGGAVLSWITGENNHTDYDFFFKDTEAADSFQRFVANYGFVLTKRTGYATTLFNLEAKLIVQVVDDSRFFGSPSEVLNRFDITVCKFAVDCDYLYTDTLAVRDLITRSIRIWTISNTDITTGRIVKYRTKGFYIPNNLVKYNESYTNVLPTYTLSSW